MAAVYLPPVLAGRGAVHVESGGSPTPHRLHRRSFSRHDGHCLCLPFLRHVRGRDRPSSGLHRRDLLQSRRVRCIEEEAYRLFRRRAVCRRRPRRRGGASLVQRRQLGHGRRHAVCDGIAGLWQRSLSSCAQAALAPQAIRDLRGMEPNQAACWHPQGHVPSPGRSSFRQACCCLPRMGLAA